MDALQDDIDGMDALHDDIDGMDAFHDDIDATICCTDLLYQYCCK